MISVPLINFLQPKYFNAIAAAMPIVSVPKTIAFLPCFGLDLPAARHQP